MKIPDVKTVLYWGKKDQPFDVICKKKKKSKLRESFPRQVDRESRGPQGERGLEFSRRKKGQSLDSTFCYLKMLIMGVELVFTRMYLA